MRTARRSEHLSDAVLMMTLPYPGPMTRGLGSPAASHRSALR